MAGVQEKKNMAAVDEALKKAAEDIASTGIKISVTCDWEAYDELPFDEVGVNRTDHLQKVELTVESLGTGFKRVCEDADYKEALEGVKKIVFRPTNDNSITMRATLKGSALTIEDYTFGSTRDASDYYSAIRKSVD